MGRYALGIQVFKNRFISRQTDNPWPSYSQDLNLPDYFLRGYLKERVCENNSKTREDIIKKEIRQIAQEMLNKVVDNFIVRVVAVLSYSSAVRGTCRSIDYRKSIANHY